MKAKGLTGRGYEYEYMGATSLWRLPDESISARSGGAPALFADRRHSTQALSRRTACATGAIHLGDVTLINSQAAERTGYPRRNGSRLLVASLRPIAKLATWCSTLSSTARPPASPLTCWAASGMVSTFRRKPSRWSTVDNRINRPSASARCSTTATSPFATISRSLRTLARSHPRARIAIRSTACRRATAAAAADNSNCVFWNVDHIIAQAHGGTNHIENLQLLCPSCNHIKIDLGMDCMRVRLQ